MKIHLAADHAGFEHKEALKAHLLERGHEILDHGALTLTEGDDYPAFMALAAAAVAMEPGSMGIIFGGSGEGEAMVANRHKGIRCAVYYGGEKEILTYSRLHNDANMLAVSARFVTTGETNEAVDLWLDTEFSHDERHVRRLAQF